MPDFKYLDATDLPSDPNGSLGQVRTAIRQAYNTNRNSIEKLQLLSDTLVLVVGMIEVGLDTLADNEKSTEYLNQETINAQKEVETPTVNDKRVIRRNP